MIALRSLKGTTGVLRNYEIDSRSREVGGEHSLSFRVFGTAEDPYFGLVTEETFVDYENEWYVVKHIKETTQGYIRVREAQCEQYTVGIVEDRAYDTLGNKKKKTATLKEVCDYISSKTRKYELYYPESLEKETREIGDTWGDDNLANLIDAVRDLWGLELRRHQNRIYLETKIGPSTQFQIRYAHNIKMLTYEADSNDLRTYIRGYGKKDEKKKTQVTAEYTSPNAELFGYGIRHAEPLRDERFTSQDSLIREMKKQLQDVPAITFDVEIEELQKAGLDAMPPVLGMEFWLIHELMGIDMRARIIAIEDYPESNRSAKITVSTRKNTLTALLVKREKQARRLDKLVTRDGKIKAEAITGFLDLDQSAIELINDADDLIQFRIGKLEDGREGIFKTTDGGTTWEPYTSS